MSWALDGISNTQTINPDALGHDDEERTLQPGYTFWTATSIRVLII